MRYYEVIFRDINQALQVDASGNRFGPYTTRAGIGLQLEFDVNYTASDLIDPATIVKMYGVPISILRQAVQLVGGSVQIFAGFEAGLPLANPMQQGEILNGRIVNAWSDWVGANQCLNVAINPNVRPATESEVFSITVDAEAGEKLSDVIRRALVDAYPEKQIQVSISDDLILSEAWKGVYWRVSQFAAMIRSQSVNMLGINVNYAGISVVVQGERILVFDNSDVATTVAGAAKAIQPYELLGQPSWIGFNKIAFKCPLRADIQCGDLVSLPAQITSGAGGILMRSTAFTYPPRTTSSFSGEFIVIGIRHVGRFLDANGTDSWSTIYTVIAPLASRKTDETN